MTVSSGYKINKNLYEWCQENGLDNIAEKVYTMRGIVGKWQKYEDVVHDILEHIARKHKPVHNETLADEPAPEVMPVAAMDPAMEVTSGV